MRALLTRSDQDDLLLQSMTCFLRVLLVAARMARACKRLQSDSHSRKRERFFGQCLICLSPTYLLSVGVSKE